MIGDKRICQFCGYEFVEKKSTVGLFCSRECHNKNLGKNTWIDKKCKYCRKKFTSRGCHNRKYCSHICAMTDIGKGIDRSYTQTQDFKDKISKSQYDIWDKRKNGELKQRDTSIWHTDEWKQTQSKRLKKFYSENRHPGIKFTLEQEEQIVELYLDFNSTPKIAKIFDVSSNCIRCCLKRNNIPRRKMKGDFHPFWKGGRRHYYGSNWKKQKLLALERDGYQCQNCSDIDDLVVHHIVKIRLFPYDKRNNANELSNLITLCRLCHKEVHMNHMKLLLGNKRISFLNDFCKRNQLDWRKVA